MIRILLDKTLIYYEVSRYEFSKHTSIQYQVIDNHYKNKVVRYDSLVLEQICYALDCDVTDIIEFVKE